MRSLIQIIAADGAANDNSTRDEWIFDAKTHEFLGEREVATADLPKSGIKKGDVLGNASVLRRATVDKAGQRP